MVTLKIKTWVITNTNRRTRVGLNQKIVRPLFKNWSQRRRARLNQTTFLVLKFINLHPRRKKSLYIVPPARFALVFASILLNYDAHDHHSAPASHEGINTSPVPPVWLRMF